VTENENLILINPNFSKEKPFLKQFFFKEKHKIQVFPPLTEGVLSQARFL